MAPDHNRRRGDPDDSEAHVHRRSTDANAVLHLHSRVAAAGQVDLSPEAVAACKHEVE